MYVCMYVCMYVQFCNGNRALTMVAVLDVHTYIRSAGAVVLFLVLCTQPLYCSKYVRVCVCACVWYAYVLYCAYIYPSLSCRPDCHE